MNQQLLALELPRPKSVAKPRTAVAERPEDRNAWGTPRGFVRRIVTEVFARRPVVQRPFALRLPDDVAWVADLAATAETAVAPLWAGPGGALGPDAFALTIERITALSDGPLWLNPPFGRSCRTCGVATGDYRVMPAPEKGAKGPPGCVAEGHDVVHFGHWIRLAVALATPRHPVLVLGKFDPSTRAQAVASALCHTRLEVIGRLAFETGGQGVRGADFPVALWLFDGTAACRWRACDREGYLLPRASVGARRAREVLERLDRASRAVVRPAEPGLLPDGPAVGADHGVELVRQRLGESHARWWARL